MSGTLNANRIEPIFDPRIVFNPSFLEEMIGSRDDIIEEFKKNTYLQEVTVNCNLFNPPKEYNAYLYLNANEAEYPTKPGSMKIRYSFYFERFIEFGFKTSPRFANF